MKIEDNLEEQIKDKDDFFYYYYKLKGGSDYANVTIEFKYNEKEYVLKEVSFDQNKHVEYLSDCGDWSIRELYITEKENKNTLIKTYRFLREALEDKIFDEKSFIEQLNQGNLTITRMSS